MREAELTAGQATAAHQVASPSSLTPQLLLRQSLLPPVAAYLLHSCIPAYHLSKTADRQNHRICKESGKAVDTQYPKQSFTRSDQSSAFLTKSQYFNT